MKFFTFFLQQAKIGVYSFSPVADLYRWKDNNICFAYGIKVRCYGKHVEELIGNKGKMNKKAFPWSAPPPKSLKEKKNNATWVHAWTFPLAAWNFSSQMSLSGLG